MKQHRNGSELCPHKTNLIFLSCCKRRSSVSLISFFLSYDHDFQPFICRWWFRCHISACFTNRCLSSAYGGLESVSVCDRPKRSPEYQPVYVKIRLWAVKLILDQIPLWAFFNRSPATACGPPAVGIFLPADVTAAATRGILGTQEKRA